MPPRFLDTYEDLRASILISSQKPHGLGLPVIMTLSEPRNLPAPPTDSRLRISRKPESTSAHGVCALYHYFNPKAGHWIILSWDWLTGFIDDDTHLIPLRQTEASVYTARRIADVRCIALWQRAKGFRFIRFIFNRKVMKSITTAIGAPNGDASWFFGRLLPRRSPVGVRIHNPTPFQLWLPL